KTIKLSSSIWRLSCRSSSSSCCCCSSQGHFGPRKRRAPAPPSPSRTTALTPSGRAHCPATGLPSSAAADSSFP
ncbi:unnamed protein product, partial [Musa acuminata subsp. burmannicoides]